MLQISFVVSSALVAEFSELLTEAGAVAVTLQDAAEEPLYEPPLGSTPLWSRTQVIALFEAATDIAAIVATFPDPLSKIEYAIKPVADQDWARACLDNFHPLRFGSLLWVCPSWHTPPDPQAINLLLDPGLAFGTGTHATTALCLEWLAETELDALDVIDYGCGSGILAIAAAKLGARSVWAVDNDPQALQATRDNATKNGVAGHMRCSLPDTQAHMQTDLLLANILAGPLIDFAHYFAGLVRPSGRILLSGILSAQAQQVAQAYAAWFVMSPAVEREGWVRLEGKRKSVKV